MNHNHNSRKNFPLVVSLLAYTIGAALLFITPSYNVFFSPGLAVAITGVKSPLFFSMLLLAATSIIFLVSVFKKIQNSAPTKSQKKQKNSLKKILKKTSKKLQKIWL